MIDTTITVSGTVTNPNLKRGDLGYEIEKFTFDVTVPMPSDLEEALATDRLRVWTNHYLQSKIDYLNKYRTAHINKRLVELGLTKPKRQAIPPELLGMVNKLLAAKQTLSPDKFAELAAVVKEQIGIDL